MAKALIIDDEYGKLAMAYYIKFPDEPISSKATAAVEKPEFVSKTSLDTLLSSILGAFKTRNFKGSDLVIVSHGNERGMTMRLFPGDPPDARSENLDTLMMSDVSPDEKAKALRLKRHQIDQLMDKRDEVKKIGLGHVAFRGCTIGGEPRNLSVLKDFLGAAAVSGTSIYSTYGFTTPKFAKTKAQFDKWVASFSAQGHFWTGKSRVIFHTVSTKDPLVEILALYVESKEHLLEWLQGVFFASTGPDVANAAARGLPVHYLSRKPPVLPLDGRSKKVHTAAVGYADFIFETS